MANKFPEGVALVIGGSGGMGATICQTLAANGSDIALTYNSNRERADKVAGQIRALGRQAFVYRLNIADPDSVAAATGELAQQQRIHTVVIASGSDIKQPLIRDLTPADWRAVVDADVNGFFNVLHYTLPHLKAGGGGSYVHLSSAGLHRWPDGDVLSVAPKACIESLLQGVAKEEGRYRIRCNSIAVGVIETGILLRLWDEGVFDEKWRAGVLKNLCLKRFGKPEEIAEAVQYLATAEYVTGQMISVSGGYGV
jgi:NAD(P)-dependent dehydrogenase (short-subunit alcohol dehydrogenase family)